MEGAAPDPERGHVDWSAVLAGALIALGAAVVLTTLAAGLALAALPLGDVAGIRPVWAILAALALVVSLLGPYFLGGYIAGRMRRRSVASPQRETAMRDGVGGLAVWAIGLILSLLLAAGLVGGAVRGLANSVEAVLVEAGAAVDAVIERAGGVGGAIEDLAGKAREALPGTPELPSPQDALPESLQSGAIDYIVDRLLRPDERQSIPQIQREEIAEFRRQVAAILFQVVRSGDISSEDEGFLRRRLSELTGLAQETASARIEDAVARARDIRAEAAAKVENAKARADQLRGEAEERIAQAKEKAASLVATLRLAAVFASLLLVVSACLAAGAAWFGAIRGGRVRDRIAAGL
ncbi:hypothetical protein RGQ15_03595 [Paracoccus sp. MBLB3053]|uniref:DUF4239 domain-containing protein n=1 Tax=Paracoccus aurantius TaxID=3073814 RepID=A0ABU2HNP1_9RHOB|nr:hypothetical protein [Paracoccus sp. MBLB3053]MDS9466664.1 hypothetical protein [Paracoccus sp. MBLB3053]